MARYKEKSKAIALRKKGYSYSQIKKELGIGKGTLSAWLADYPLSDKRIRELRDNNPQRIEKYIKTMRKKREVKFSIEFEKAKKEIGKITERELFIAGFFLYWAEGGKTRRNALTFSNTDPSMLRVYIKWLKLIGVPKDKLKVRLHLYKDMDVNKEVLFWHKELELPKSQFKNAWIKNSRMTDLTYKNNFGHGTCNVILYHTVTTVYTLMGIKFIGTVLNTATKDTRL
jgi:hypothetical protein